MLPALGRQICINNRAESTSTEPVNLVERGKSDAMGTILVTSVNSISVSANIAQEGPEGREAAHERMLPEQLLNI